MKATGLGRFVSSASFWQPDYVDVRSFWIEHAPFAFWLVGALKPRTIVELGTYSGFSYLCFCQAVANHGLVSTAFAVDTWEGDRHMGAYGSEVLEELASYHDPRYSSFSRLVRSTFDDAVSHFEDGSIDLLHLDGVHTYDLVKHDFETWAPKLSSCSVVLFHDTNVREQDFGVHQLWSELRQTHPGFEFLHGQGLGVLGFGAEVPATVVRLLEAEANPALCGDLRTVYARLGNAIRQPAVTAVQREAELTRLGETLAATEAERARLELELADTDARREALDVALTQAGERRAALDLALVQAGDRNAALELSLAQAGERGAELELALASAKTEREGQERRLQAVIAEADAERERFVDAARALEGDIAAAQARGMTLETELAQLRAEFEAVLGSESWRITAPLRTMMFWTRRLVGRARRVVRLRTRLRRLRARRAAAQPDAHVDSEADSQSPRDALLRSVGREPTVLDLEGESDLAPELRDEAVVARADAWVAQNGARPHDSNLRLRPLVSILLPSYNTPAGLLEVAVESVLRQTYTNWELVVVDDGSTAKGMRQRLGWVEGQDPRIRVVRNHVNRGISHATNDALGAAVGEFVAMLDHDDELLPDALLEVVRRIERDPEIDVVYTDQEYVEVDGSPSGTFVKPDWSPTMFCGVMYVGHLLVVRRTVANAVGGFDPAFDNVQDFEFMLRVSEATDRIAHAPAVLYRWRRVPGSVAYHGDEKSNINDLQAQAVTAHFKRRGIPAVARPNTRHAHRAQIVVNPDGNARVAAVLWPGDRDATAETRTALAGQERSLVATLELEEADSWRSTLEEIESDFVLSLEPGLAPQSSDWLAQLLLHCRASNSGAVSGLIVDPAGYVDESGLVVGLAGAFGPAMRGWPADSDGYAGSLSCSREVSAVSGRCALIARETLLQLTDSRPIFSDRLAFWVDLSLRARAHGLRNVVASQAVFRRVRPADAPDISLEELDAAVLRERWRERLAAPDPYHSSRFQRDGGGFVLPSDG